MTTAYDLAPRTRRLLVGGLREKLNWLDGGHDDSTTTITLSDDASTLRRGQLLEVDDELMYVREVDGNDVTVRRGHQDTEATSHDDDAEVRIDPHFPTAEVARTIAEEVGLLRGTGLVHYYHDTLDISFPATRSYAIDEDALGVYSVFSPLSSDTADGRSPVRYRVHDTEEGRFLHVLSELRGDHLDVVYYRHYDLPETTASELEVPEEVIPVLFYGAAWRLILSQESQRVNPRAEHGSRRAEEVQPGANAFVARAFQSMREDAIADALDAQRKAYPPRQVS